MVNETTAPATGAADGEEMLANPSFEDWDNEHLKAWSVGEGQGKTWRRGAVARSHMGEKRKYVLVLPNPAPGQLFVIAQNVGPGKIRPDNTLLFQARAKSPMAYCLTLRVSFLRGAGAKKRETMRQLHNSKAGEWEDLEWRFEVPPDADPGSFRFEIILQNKDHQGVTLVDDVSLRHEPVRPWW